MYSGDNDTYMKTAYNGDYSVGGAIFMDGENRSDFSDSHILLYGHNMKDLSMFGKLKWYRDNGHYEGHQYFQIITPTGKDRYEIVSYRDYSVLSGIFNVVRDEGSESYKDVFDAVMEGARAFIIAVFYV